MYHQQIFTFHWNCDNCDRLAERVRQLEESLRRRRPVPVAPPPTRVQDAMRMTRVAPADGHELKKAKKKLERALNFYATFGGQ